MIVLGPAIEEGLQGWRFFVEAVRLRKYLTSNYTSDVFLYVPARYPSPLCIQYLHFGHKISILRTCPWIYLENILEVSYRAEGRGNEVGLALVSGHKVGEGSSSHRLH